MSAAGPVVRFRGPVRIALVVAAVTLVLGGLGFRAAVDHLQVVLRKEPVAPRRPFASIPRTLGGWEAQGDDYILPAATVESLGTDRYLNRSYRGRIDGRDRFVHVHIAYYTGMIDAVPHIPDRCFVAGGMQPRSTPSNEALDVSFPEARLLPSVVNGAVGAPYRALDVPHPVTGLHETVHLPFGDYALRTSAFQDPDDPAVELLAGYFFIANHRMTPSPAGIRALAFRLSERYAYYVKVQLAMTVPEGESTDGFLAASSDLLQALLPHLMRCLPDWTEIDPGPAALGAAPAPEGKALAWHPE